MAKSISLYGNKSWITYKQPAEAVEMAFLRRLKGYTTSGKIGSTDNNSRAFKWK